MKAVIAWVFRLCAWSAMLGGIFFLLPLGVPQIENAASYAAVRELLRIDREWHDALRALVPTKFGGTDIARWILVGGLFVLHFIFDRIFVYFRGQQIADGIDPKLLEQAQGAMAGLQAGGVRSRAALLEILKETQNKLESMQRDLAFLSIDVVGSTDMKIGEERTQIEIDFREYKKLVEKEINAQGVMTSAWTPDGVMICFATADAAVAAGQGVINALQTFNKNVKKIRGNFRVRCGVNAGKVYYDKSIPMEQMSDHVIDVAGHMQKYALPNTVALAKGVLGKLQRREGFKPTGKEVDGFEVYHWGK